MGGGGGYVIIISLKASSYSCTLTLFIHKDMRIRVSVCALFTL